MELLNGTTDLILAAACVFVFFKYLKPLSLSTTILWESFVLSMGVAAFLGALVSFGFYNLQEIADFFQNITVIAGALGLVAASFSIVTDYKFPDTRTYGIIGIGIALFLVFEFLNVFALRQWVPVVSMILVALIAMLSFTKGKPIIGGWLLIGVIFFALASYKEQIFGRSTYSISLYHLLLTAGILSIGMANYSYRINQAHK